MNIPADTPAPKRRGYGGRSAEDLAAERRRRLLDSALELFGTQGYAATPVEKLCAHARVTTRHFYEQFSDREALLIAVFEEVMTATGARVLAALAAPGTAPGEHFAAALQAFLDAQLEDPRRARLTTTEVLGVSPRVEARRNAVIGGFARVIESHAAQLVDSGVLPPRNYRVMAYGIVGAMHELQIAWLDGANGLSKDTLRDEALFLVRAFVKGARVAG